MTTDFAAALEEGADLLRSLPRRRAAVAEARQAAGRWSERHPSVRAQLVVDQRPGTQVVDYDLLLDHPDGGTVALSAPPDDGVPWLVDHSTHWAAGHLVSVDDVHVSVPQALTMLRSLSRGNASPYQESSHGNASPYQESSHGSVSPYQEIVDQCLLAAAVDEDAPVSPEDLQATADEFRRGRGLRDRASTLAWMAAAGMSGERFEAYVAGIARRRRFRLDKEAELAPGYLAAHRERFARVKAVWVTGREKVSELGTDLAAYEEVTVATLWAGELPGVLRDAPVGEVAGPEELPDGRFLTGRVLSRTPAVADAETLAAAGRAAFAGWLAERRATARVEWHRS